MWWRGRGGWDGGKGEVDGGRWKGKGKSFGGGKSWWHVELSHLLAVSGVGGAESDECVEIVGRNAEVSALGKYEMYE